MAKQGVVYYKILRKNRQPAHGGSGQWPNPGVWRTVEGEIQPCVVGLHFCRLEHLRNWLLDGGSEVWEFEVRRGAKIVDHGDKLVTGCGRLVKKIGTLNDRKLRLFAADCAERVLPIFEKDRPNDKRPRDAIQAARDFADGKIGAAAWAAAWAAAGAAGAAAWAAAWAAERAWQDTHLLAIIRRK